jgi:hypothetical protein
MKHSPTSATGTAWERTARDAAGGFGEVEEDRMKGTANIRCSPLEHTENPHTDLS